MKNKIFTQDFELLRNEVDSAIESFFTYISMHNEIASDAELKRKINKNPTFWLIVLSSLQTKFFISLGKIFDDHKHAHSIGKLKCSIDKNKELFSNKELAKRKSPNGVIPDWLDDYIMNTMEPTSDDFRKFKKQFAKCRSIWNLGCKDIRNKVIAHIELKEPSEITNLFQKTNILEIEEMLYTLHDTLESLWQLQHNGGTPVFGVREYGYKSRIKSTTASAMKSLT